MPIVGRFGSLAGLGSLILPGGAMESIATVTVGSGGASEAVFSDIPGVYQHLQIRYLARTNRSDLNADRVQMRFNGDTGSNYYLGHRLVGNGSVFADALGSSTSIATFIAAATTSPSSVYGGSIIDILDYTSTSKNKVVRILGGADSNTVAGEIYMTSGMWFPSTIAAITSIRLYPNIGTSFNQHSTFSLFGLRAP